MQEIAALCYVHSVLSLLFFSNIAALKGPLLLKYQCKVFWYMLLKSYVWLKLEVFSAEVKY